MASPRASRRFLISLVALVAAAFALRAVHVASILGSPLGDTLVEDARFYHQEALRILDGGDRPGAPFMNLGYPYALAAIHSVLGRSVAASLFVQAFLGALTCGFLASAARRLARSDAVGLLAGALYAAYAGAIFYDGLLLTPSLTNLCLATTLHALAVYLDTGRSIPAGGAGVALAFAILLRANLLLLVPALALLAFFAPLRDAEPSPRRKRASAAVLFLASSLLLPLLVVSYNGVVHHQWAPVSANGGANFWIGNNRNAEGIYYAADFLSSQTAAGEQRAFLAEARRRTGSYGMTDSAASDFWLREGWSEIRARPSRWISIEGRKAALFWNAYEAKTNVGMELLSTFSPVLAWSPVRFAVLAVLGIGGLTLLFARRKRSQAWLLAAFIGAPFLTCLAFFVSGEYRHPASLALAIGAAWLLRSAAEVAPDLVRSRRGGSRPRAGARCVGVASVVAALALPLVLWRFPQLRLSLHPDLDFANYARQIAATRESGSLPSRANVARALDLLEIGRARGEGDVALADARLWVQTWASVELQDEALARDAFTTARSLLARDLRPDPRRYSDYQIRRVAGGIRDCMTEIAEQPFVRASPTLAREAELLGSGGYSEFNRRFSRMDFEGALAFVDEALAIAPHHVGLLAAKGQTLLALGRETEGLVWLGKSCAGWPAIADCAYLAAEHHASKGDTRRAASEAREALRRDPRHARARQLLSRLEGEGAQGP